MGLMLKRRGAPKHQSRLCRPKSAFTSPLIGALLKMTLLGSVALLSASTLDRYAASNANFVLAVGPHSGPAARSAAKQALSNQPRALPGYQGQSPWLVSVPSIQREPAARPNIVILLTDDMGYGDLSSYGHPSIKTPHIDQLAAQGIRFTSFVTGAWCVPSRTQLLTGRYMPRVTFGGGTGADGEGGLPDSELTLAEGLKEAGYATAMVGKWHLGYKQKKFLPPNQGFDYWFGLPYSNDYTKPWVQTDEPLALYRGTEIVTHPIDQETLTIDQTKEAVKLIEGFAGKHQPFFLYLAYYMPHLPVNTTQKFRGQSGAGLYGDVIETIDWSVGQVLEALSRHGLADNTIAFFASDNGPWLNPPERMLQAGNELWHTGSPGPLRGSKATTYEGGARVPAMIRWPGHIQPHQVSDALVAMPDIYRTLLEVGRAKLPDHPLDGYDMVPFLTGRAEESPRNEYFYFLHGELEAMRQGAWKLRLAGGEPELFNLQLDPEERYNRAAEKPEMVNQLERKMRQFADDVGSKIRKEGGYRDLRGQPWRDRPGL